MTKYTPEHLTNLLVSDREKLTQICAEVLGWRILRRKLTDVDWWAAGELGEYKIPVQGFQPLSNTEKGRSQAFELAVKFDCFPVGIIEGEWIGEIRGAIFGCETPQAAIVIASILRAQQEK